MPILCTSFLKETHIENKSGSPGTYPNKDSQIEVWLSNEMFNFEKFLGIVNKNVY